MQGGWEKDLFLALSDETNHQTNHLHFGWNTWWGSQQSLKKGVMLNLKYSQNIFEPIFNNFHIL